MALKAVEAAVEARLKTGWQHADLCPIRGLNERSDKPQKGKRAHLKVEYPVGSSEQASMGAPGANLFRDEGAIRFVLNIERGTGVKVGLAWIEELAALFRGKDFDGVTTHAPSPPVLDDGNDDGIWFTLSFAVPYEFDGVG